MGEVPTCVSPTWGLHEGLVQMDVWVGGVYRCPPHRTGPPALNDRGSGPVEGSPELYDIMDLVRKQLAKSVMRGVMLGGGRGWRHIKRRAESSDAGRVEGAC